MDIKEFEFLRRMAETDHFTEEEFEVVDKACADKARELYSGLCNEQDVCEVCGAKMRHDGSIVLNNNLSMAHQVIEGLTMCSNESCQSTKDMIDRAEKMSDGMIRRSMGPDSGFRGFPWKK